MKNVKTRMDLYGEKNGPSIIMEFDVYKNNYIDVTRRGDEIRFITEITRDNLHYCKLYYLCFIDTTCVFHRQVNKFFDTFSWNINPGAEIP